MADDDYYYYLINGYQVLVSRPSKQYTITRNKFTKF